MSAPGLALPEAVASGLRAVEERLAATLGDDATEVAALARPVILAGGKRLRPTLVLLAAELGDGDRAAVVDVAAGIELIHTATLIHDDVIDDSPLRRGVPAVHTGAGADAAIIVGDHYLAKGLGMVAGAGGAAVAERLAATVMAICAGEVAQIGSRLDLGRTVADYDAAIERKTALLIEASCYAGAVTARAPAGVVAAVSRYGRDLGMAFQIADDVLDYASTAVAAGKPVGADLRQGTVTLPLMIALGLPSAGPALRALLEHVPLDDARCAEAVEIVRRSGAAQTAATRAAEFAASAREALAALAAGPARDALAALCDQVARRSV